MSSTQHSSPLFFYGLPNDAAKAYFICQKYVSAKAQTLFVTNRETTDFEQAAHAFAAPDVQVVSFPQNTPGQLGILYELAANPQRAVVLCAAYEALQVVLPSPETLLKNTCIVRKNDTLRRQELLDRLEAAGYNRTEYTEVPGDYSARGSVVDIFSLCAPQPLRIYFSGNTVESIYLFDLDTQSTHQTLTQAVIIPLHFQDTSSKLTDYLTNPILILDEPAPSFSVDNFQPAAIITQLPQVTATNCGLKTNPDFHQNWNLLDREVNSLQKQGAQVRLCCLNKGELDRFSEILADYPTLRKTPLTLSSLTQGFYSPADKIAFITSNEMLNRRYNTSQVLRRFDVEGARRVRFKELEVGDYVVHQEHGIGRYLGLEVLDATSNPTDCLKIEYRRGSRLYVPLYDFKKVQKYIGAGGKRPTLSTLGGGAWREIKKRVKEEAQKTAQEILKLEALRQATPAPQITGDARIEQEFADSFPYTLTPGQEDAIRDVLHDLDLPKPMDRVLVGDVGFGKTEVALRAALKVVLSGKQVMLLVPTTILAAQHYKTFTKRLAGFPVQVQMLCRFQTPKEQRQVISELKNGVCDIIIGTHRLMSKDIAFHDLGLVIIDEEHRFGVKQKEKIRAKSAGVHSLMLSATPIPRTLNQSLSSLRDISLIDTPPRGRTPIKTVVTAWNNELAAAAISQELARNGQIYYVYNSVRNMESRLLFLRQLVPQARICMAHGQMNEQEL